MAISTHISEVGEGTTFHIYLPAQLPIIEDANLPDISSETRGSGELLLLVEDDYSTREADENLAGGFKLPGACSSKWTGSVRSLRANRTGDSDGHQPTWLCR